jgi:hypothetical protein
MTIEESDEALAKDLVPYIAVVAGANGKGGSGTCIELEDGAIAVLTARHVVWECLRSTGHVGIAAYGVKLQDPDLIRMDSTQDGDVAYLVFKKRPTTVKAVPFAEWTTTRLDLLVGQRVVTAGFPGAFRKVEGRKISPGMVWLGDVIRSIEAGRVATGIDETLEGIPSTFEGLSGAGLFSADRKFVGVVVEERRKVTESFGQFHSLLPCEFAELHTARWAPSGHYHNEQRALRLTLLKPDKSVQAIVGVLAQCIWTGTEEKPEERYGRLYTIEFVIPGIDQHYPININSTFTWTGDSEEDRLNAMREEFKFLLLRMRWLVKEDFDGKATLEVKAPL